MLNERITEQLARLPLGARLLARLDPDPEVGQAVVRQVLDASPSPKHLKLLLRLRDAGLELPDQRVWDWFRPLLQDESVKEAGDTHSDVQELIAQFLSAADLEPEQLGEAFHWLNDTRSLFTRETENVAGGGMYVGNTAPLRALLTHDNLTDGEAAYLLDRLTTESKFGLADNLDRYLWRTVLDGHPSASKRIWAVVLSAASSNTLTEIVEDCVRQGHPEHARQAFQQLLDHHPGVVARIVVTDEQSKVLTVLTRQQLGSLLEHDNRTVREAAQRHLASSPPGPSARQQHR